MTTHKTITLILDNNYTQEQLTPILNALQQLKHINQALPGEPTNIIQEIQQDTFNTEYLHNILDLLHHARKQTPLWQEITQKLK